MSLRGEGESDEMDAVGNGKERTGRETDSGYRCDGESGEGERRIGTNGERGSARWDDAALKHSMEENAAERVENEERAIRKRGL